MTTLARLEAIHDAAYRNNQPDVCAALRLLRDDVAALEADAARLDWLEQTASSLMRGSQPDMGGYDWRISNPQLPSSRGRTRGRSVRDAIDTAMKNAK